MKKYTALVVTLAVLALPTFALADQPTSLIISKVMARYEKTASFAIEGNLKLDNQSVASSLVLPGTLVGSFPVNFQGTFESAEKAGQALKSEVCGHSATLPLTFKAYPAGRIPDRTFTVTAAPAWLSFQSVDQDGKTGPFALDCSTGTIGLLKK